MSFIEIKKKVVDDLGFKNFKCLWYKHPRFALSCGSKSLNSDKDVLQLTNDCKGFEIVEIYVKHVIDVPIIGEEFVNEGGSDFVTIDDSDSGGEGDVQRKGVGDDPSLISILLTSLFQLCCLIIMFISLKSCMSCEKLLIETLYATHVM